MASKRTLFRRPLIKSSWEGLFFFSLVTLVLLLNGSTFGSSSASLDFNSKLSTQDWRCLAFWLNDNKFFFVVLFVQFYWWESVFNNVFIARHPVYTTFYFFILALFYEEIWSVQLCHYLVSASQLMVLPVLES